MTWARIFGRPVRALDHTKHGRPITTETDVNLFDGGRSNKDEGPIFSSSDSSETRRAKAWLADRLKRASRLKTPESEVVSMTPALAEIILASNTFNRPITATAVKKLAREINAGHWKLTGQPVIVADDGTLIDGQHRLSAIVAAGAAVPILVLFGIDKGAFDKIDNGGKGTRTAADIFAVRGEAHYATLASATRAVWRCENTGMMPRPEMEPEAAELWHYMDEKHPGLRDIAPHGVALYAPTGWGAPSLFVALEYLCSRLSAKAAADFYTQLATGNDIGSRTKNHPVIRLRTMFQADIKERALGRGTAPLVKAAYTIKAWNAWRE